MTLKSKFTWLSAAVIAVILLAAVHDFIMTRALVADAHAEGRAAAIVRAHMHADMMHDAVQSQVMKALYARSMNNSALLQEARTELLRDGTEFSADIERALALDPPDDIRQDMRANALLAVEYTRLATSIASRTLGKNQEEMEQFHRMFETLREKNEAISGKLASYIAQRASRAADTADTALRRHFAIAFAVVLVALMVPLFARRQVFEPQEKLIALMKDISAGRLDGQVPFTNRTDEIGQIAAALAIFRQNVEEKRRLESEAEALKKRAEEERRGTMFGLADNFEAKVKSVADTVASAATEMDATSRDVMKRAQDSAEKLGKLVVGIAGASQNVQTVAAATTELSASIRGIAEQVENGEKIMTSAVGEAGRANETAESLSEAAEKIGGVVDVINEITAQINLLALNATIEAARAGEQGKGFSVVAAEVKNLAGQTTLATRQIEEQVSFIQQAASDTVGVLQQISETINEMNKISATIANAVVAQGAATQEIARNVQQAAEITHDVSTHASDVKLASTGASSAVSQMIAAASDLSRQSESLRGQVGNFLRDIKAA
ncbi:MAG: methyl-accepting chemotaxis sensory transducer [Alphaproteobacteria bacterium]|jgi:methyl-accepting chemotaxis protein|nr:methyl-accepting chemotaxis sensory transducer [Alphaproteobacteria bacterium]